MVRFALKIVLFFVLLIATSTLARMAADYDWGNPLFAAKVDVMASRPAGTFTTVYMGSSRVYRHLDPHVVDSTWADRSGAPASSFNLGTTGLLAQEQAYLVDQGAAARLGELGVRRVVLELQPYFDVRGATQQYYWLDFERFLSSVRGAFGRYGASIEALRETGLLGSAYVVRLFNLGITRVMFDPSTGAVTEGGLRADGFYPVDAELTETGAPALVQRREAFLEDEEQIVTERAGIARAAHERRAEGTPAEAHLADWARMRASFEEEGIELWAVLLPRSFEDLPHAMDLLATLDRLDVAGRIDLTDPDRYPDFYSVERSFDRGHLDAEGARLISIAFGEALAGASLQR